MFPLLRLLTGEAPVLIEHAEAYVELAAEEFAAAAAGARRRVVALVLCLLAGAMAVGFGGFALMLWGALAPEPEGPARWLLWAVPGACGLGALMAAWVARAQPRARAFAELRAQWRQDMALLREGLTR